MSVCLTRREWELAKQVGALQDVPAGFSRLVRHLLIREIKRAVLDGELPGDALRRRGGRAGARLAGAPQTRGGGAAARVTLAPNRYHGSRTHLWLERTVPHPARGDTGTDVAIPTMHVGT